MKRKLRKEIKVSLAILLMAITTLTFGIILICSPTLASLMSLVILYITGKAITEILEKE